VRFHKLPNDRGVLIMELEAGSPAAIAGLRPNDTIVGFKGQSIASVDDLHKQLVAAEIGVASPLMFLRGTEKLFCMVIPRELPPLAQGNGERRRH
jgi:S1-C subfamily serine protease